jgi:hypothetical protein
MIDDICASKHLSLKKKKNEGSRPDRMARRILTD